ncbi:MAG: PilW family protein [Gammaproteobacteria bacterium]|nr:PilW family protein [Gammaproteobacteria bacterium]MBU1655302.1 PilW family protein [Gammaproteobacteria bacterium]MBU1960772.1 PilW family protein [Gammaproteobacteria bacterium]
MKPLSIKNSGLSLVEMMVAMTLSLVLIAGVISLFVSSKKSYTESEHFARLQENALYAMFTLERDLRMAGFFGWVRGSEVTGSKVDVDCTGVASAYQTADFLAVEKVAKDGTAFGCIKDGEPDTNVLVIKHTISFDEDNETEEINKTYIRTTRTYGRLYDGKDGRPAGMSPGKSWEYQASIYYIRTGSLFCTPVPCLSRMSLQNSSWVTEDLAVGVERMALLFGVDSDGDGDIDSFAPANKDTDWLSVGAVRVTLLVSDQDEDPFYPPKDMEGKIQYNLGAGDPKPDIQRNVDKYHRTVISTTIGLRNPQFVVREAGI